MMHLKLFLFITFVLIANQSLAQSLINPDDLLPVSDYTIVQNNPQADTIILGLHGGPSEELNPGSFLYLESITNFSVVEVAKHEMLTPVLSNSQLTLEEATAVNDTTVALIEKAVQFYKAQNKVVVLVGFSWGAILLGEYLDDYGVDSVDKIVSMAGRLNMQKEFIDSLYNGFLPNFEDDGFTITQRTPQFFFTHGLLTLSIAAFENRYVDSLSHLDLRKMMYCYAGKDNSTGALLQEETELLDLTGATTFFIENGNHGSPFISENQEIIVDFIRESTVTTSTEIIDEASLDIYPSITQNILNIKGNDIGTIEIYNNSGFCVMQIHDILSFKQIDVSHLTSGHYIIISKGNKFLHRARFIKT